MGEDELWVAHEQPDRQLAFGAWLCDCVECFEVLRWSLRARPGLWLVLKSAMDRRVVPAAEALAVHDAGDQLESLLVEPGDWLREVFVAREVPRQKGRQRTKMAKPRLRLVPNPPTAVVE